MGKKIFTEKIFIRGIVLAFFCFLAWSSVSAEQVQKVQVNSLPDGVRITWSKADRNQRNVLVRSESGLPQSVNDGKILYDGTAGNFTDTDLQIGKKYYYSVISFTTPTVTQQVTRKVVEVVEKIPVPAKITVEAVGAGSQLLGIFTIFDSIKDIWLTFIRLSQVAVAFLTLRKKNQWGLVYDWDNKVPLKNIPLNVVNGRGEKIEGAVTDAAGRFGFMASQGEYFVKVGGIKQYHFQPESYAQHDIYGKVYSGEPIKIEKKDSSVIKLNIPLIRQLSGKEGKKVGRALLRLTKFPKFINQILELLFWAGLIFVAVSFLQNEPGPATIGVASLYGLILLLRVVMYFRHRDFGTVLDKDLKTPVPFAVVKAIKSEREEEQLGITVSNSNGGFYLLKPEGAGAIEIKGRTLEGRNYRLIKSLEPGQELIKGYYYV